jgi:hypothetical protein
MADIKDMAEHELQALVDKLRAEKDKLIAELKKVVKELEIKLELRKMQEKLTPIQLEALKRVQLVSPSPIESEEKVGNLGK